MKITEDNSKPASKPLRPAAKKRSRRRDPRVAAALVLVHEHGMAITEACREVGLSPSNASRTLGSQSTGERLFAALQIDCGITDVDIVQPVAKLLKKKKVREDAVTTVRLEKEPELFETLFDKASGAFRKDAPTELVEDDLDAQAKGTEMALKLAGQFDPERVNRVWNDGVVAGGRAVVPLLRKLEPHLDEAGKQILRDGLKDLAAGRLVG
ncbi:MAG: hypothetical protein HZC54_00770 [Verrucomicrobia bacterium]|nr:hypothetical protein [Verrucomicrobiota bacterium]